MNVILSIRPNFCKMIFSGQKKYEYRKRVFKRTDIDRGYVYASKPFCRIVGYFTIDHVIEDTPSNIWANTHKEGGITKEYFDAYFKNCHTAYAIKFGYKITHFHSYSFQVVAFFMLICESSCRIQSFVVTLRHH